MSEIPSMKPRQNIRANIARELDHGWDGDASDMRQIDSLLADFVARCQGIYGLEDLIMRAKELGY